MPLCSSFFLLLSPPKIVFFQKSIAREFWGKNGYRRWKEHQKLHRLVNFQVSINFFIALSRLSDFPDMCIVVFYCGSLFLDGAGIDLATFGCEPGVIPLRYPYPVLSNHQSPAIRYRVRTVALSTRTSYHREVGLLIFLFLFLLPIDFCYC